MGGLPGWMSVGGAARSCAPGRWRRPHLRSLCVGGGHTNRLRRAQKGSERRLIRTDAARSQRCEYRRSGLGGERGPHLPVRVLADPERFGLSPQHRSVGSRRNGRVLRPRLRLLSGGAADRRQVRGGAESGGRGADSLGDGGRGGGAHSVGAGCCGWRSRSGRRRGLALRTGREQRGRGAR